VIEIDVFNLDHVTLHVVCYSCAVVV